MAAGAIVLDQYAIYYIELGSLNGDVCCEEYPGKQHKY
jgi:hypothetical protein